METDTDLPAGATDRRTALKRAAAAAGVVAWTTPAVQVLSGGTAHAQTITGCRPMATIILKETGEGTKGGDCQCVSVLPAKCCSNNTSFPVVTASCGATCDGTVVFPVTIDPPPVFKCKDGDDVSVELSCNNLSPSLTVTVNVKCEDDVTTPVIVTAKEIICIPCAATPLAAPEIVPELDVSTVDPAVTSTSSESATTTSTEPATTTSTEPATTTSTEPATTTSTEPATTTSTEPPPP